MSTGVPTLMSCVSLVKLVLKQLKTFEKCCPVSATKTKTVFDYHASLYSPSQVNPILLSLPLSQPFHQSS